MGPMVGTPWRLVASALGAIALLAACGSTNDTAATTPPATTLPIVQATAPAGSTSTSTAIESSGGITTTTDPFVVSITIADVTLPADEGIPSLTASPPEIATVPPAPSACPGTTALPADATIGDRIIGDVDGDGADDTVTEYTAPDGSPHVFLQRGRANGSDVAVQLPGATSVSISFEDVDSSLGAEVAPPQVILAIGSVAEGTAVATFLTPSPGSGASHCLVQWSTRGSPFTFPLDQRGPFSGLLCDGAAGRRYYVLRTATPDGLGAVATTSRQIDHVGAEVSLTSLGGDTIPDDASVQRNYGDIQNCDHPPLFADLPDVPFVAPTTTVVTSTTIVVPATG
ncbi:MAG: hypothetical protein JWN39_2034 [Ilumatobacteraceae bacterium]|nr:hypothetical protein [Ilumatobacteraceae bacterium]